jgi:hypothetical protein
VVALGHEIEPPDQGRHGRIEAVALLELDGETLGEVAGADPGRLEALHLGQNRLNEGRRGAEAVRDGGRALAQIARLIDGIDDMTADQPLDWVGGGEIELGEQVLVQAHVARQRGGEIGHIVIETAARDAAPERRRDRQRVGLRRSDGARRRILVEDIVEARVEVSLDGFAAGFKPLLEPFAGRAVEGRFGRRPLDVGRRRLVLGPLQKRIALQFLIDV